MTMCYMLQHQVRLHSIVYIFTYTLISVVHLRNAFASHIKVINDLENNLLKQQKFVIQKNNFTNCYQETDSKEKKFDMTHRKDLII